MLVILTLGLIVVALFQVTGRVAMHFLADLEVAANQLLAARNMQVTGLRGDWRMLNPVLRADRLDLPAGHVSDVVLEVGMVESVLRGTLLARRLRIADAQINLEKVPGQPWRLMGTVQADDFDPQALLWDSDQLEFDGSLVFHRKGDVPVQMRAGYLGINRGGEHRHSLTLRNDAADCDADCRLDVDFHGQDRFWPVHDGYTRLAVHSDGFRLPRALSGISALHVERLQLAWERTGSDSGGTMTLRTEQLDLPGAATLSARLQASVRGHGDRHRGIVSEWRVAQGDDVWQLPDATLRADPDGVNLWLPFLDLERAGGFLRRALAAVEPAEVWLGGLNPRGNAHNVRVRLGLDGSGLAYALTLDNAAIDGFKGVPAVRGGSGELFGYERGMMLNVNAQDMVLALPDLFTGEWPLPYAQGTVQAWFGRDYFGVRGLNLRAETAGARAAGGFAMSRPPDREGQRLALLIATDRIGVAEGRRFVPYRLPDGLRTWLETAPRGGVLYDARVAYQGQFQDEPGELGRRLELSARVRDGHLRYLDDWPIVTDLAGTLSVAGQVVDVKVDRATSAGARIAASRVRVADNVVDVSLDANTPAGDALDFIRTTPLANWLNFVEPDWEAAGPLRVSGELNIPLGGAGQQTTAIRLRADLDGVDLRLPGYRVDLEALKGNLRYRFPYQMDAAGVSGRLFGEPVTLAAATDMNAGRVHLRFSGRAQQGNVWRMAGMTDPQVASGAFDFVADLGIGVTEGVVTELAVDSELDGLSIRLPAGYGKAADAAEPARVVVAFAPDYRELRFEYRDAAGWLHVEQTPLRGAIGFDAPAAHRDAVDAELVLSGSMAGFDLQQVFADAVSSPAPALGLPLRLDELGVGRIAVGDFTVTDATLNGRITAQELALDVGSDQVVGSFRRSGDEPLQAALESVVVAADPVAGVVPVADPALADILVPADDRRGDVLHPGLIAELPAADVEVARLVLGEENFGAWRFRMRPRDGDLYLTDLHADVRGVTLESDEGLVWRGSTNETNFQGSLVAGDLADVLPRWGYAPTAETASATLAGNFTWAGSPLAVDLLKLRGQATAKAEEGRFLDVEAGAGGGAQRIFSLLNFANIAKRMTLNFADVFGRGISFDQIDAVFTLNEGLLEFVEPLDVQGTGSRFRVSGRVDLAERRLDNEMIVTLPVSQSLPWYAAYVALANPLAGLGVLVGERMLRKPIEQFSSARYRIGGTLENPEVTLAGVFETTGSEPEPPDAEAAAVEPAAQPRTQESQEQHE